MSSYNHLKDYCDKERMCDVRPMRSCAGTSHSDEQVAKAVERLTDDEVKLCLDALVAMDACALALDCATYEQQLAAASARVRPRASGSILCHRVCDRRPCA